MTDYDSYKRQPSIMGQFNHPYIVKLYGVVTVENPVSDFVSKTHTCRQWSCTIDNDLYRINDWW